MKEWPKTKDGRKKTAQKVQSEMFKKMSPDKKLQVASDLSAACLKLHRLVNGNRGLNKIYFKNNNSFNRV